MYIRLYIHSVYYVALFYYCFTGYLAYEHFLMCKQADNRVSAEENGHLSLRG